MSIDPRWAGVILTIALQLIALVWGAALLTAGVRHLKTWAEGVTKTLAEVQKTHSDFNARLSVLEDRWERVP
jgi:hypothetical protein